MMEVKRMKIYDNDPLVPYKTTNIKALRTRSEIDGILAEHGIKGNGWKWDFQNNDVALFFQLRETGEDGREAINNVTIAAPLIWHKATRSKPKEWVNWDISLRVMFWYVKTHLEAAYLLGTMKTTEFLPNVILRLPDGSERKLGEVLAIGGQELSSMAKALPFREVPQQ